MLHTDRWHLLHGTGETDGRKEKQQYEAESEMETMSNEDRNL